MMSEYFPVGSSIAFTEANSNTARWTALVAAAALIQPYVWAMIVVLTVAAAVRDTATGVGAGRYLVRVRAANLAGRSAPTADALLTVGAACAATQLSFQVSGNHLAGVDDVARRDVVRPGSRIVSRVE